MRAGTMMISRRRRLPWARSVRFGGSHGDSSVLSGSVLSVSVGLARVERVAEMLRAMNAAHCDDEIHEVAVRA